MIPDMFKLFRDSEDEVKEYCQKNLLNFDSVKHSPKSCGKEDLFILHYDEELAQKELNGLIKPEPMPITLMIRKADNGLEFEQTEHTTKYLSI